MVRIILAVLVLAPFAASAQKTEEEKTLYAIGYVLGERLHSLQLTKAQMKLVDQGFSDAKVGTKAKVDPRERQQQISEFAQHRSQEVAAKTAGPNKEQ
ncbi:MAG: FKBP-type peptidyl-prolyl cis-trans isomerase N-terminal domain-containing protein, partial [Myxococcales bacterium]